MYHKEKREVKSLLSHDFIANFSGNIELWCILVGGDCVGCFNLFAVFVTDWSHLECHFKTNEQWIIVASFHANIYHCKPLAILMVGPSIDRVSVVPKLRSLCNRSHLHIANLIYFEENLYIISEIFCQS